MAGSVFVVGKVMFWGFVLGPGFRIVFGVLPFMGLFCYRVLTTVKIRANICWKIYM